MTQFPCSSFGDQSSKSPFSSLHCLSKVPDRSTWSTTIELELVPPFSSYYVSLLSYCRTYSQSIDQEGSGIPPFSNSDVGQVERRNSELLSDPGVAIVVGIACSLLRQLRRGGIHDQVSFFSQRRSNYNSAIIADFIYPSALPDLKLDINEAYLKWLTSDHSTPPFVEKYKFTSSALLLSVLPMFPVPIMIPTPLGMEYR